MPHCRHPDVISMGMQPMGSHWLERSEHQAALTAHKQERRAALGEAVYKVLPEGVDAACELARKVSEFALSEPLPLEQFPREEWLWQASLAIHEDLVVMASIGGEYTMVAASLCSPSHWRLPEKIGRPMSRIHDPIPTIHDRLTPKIDRVFEFLTVDRPVERFNWSIQEDDVLFCWPLDHEQSFAPEHPLFYRVERQTLSRLPESEALAFTIAVHIDPLESLGASPGAMQALFDAIDANPESVRRYKNFDVLAPALEKYRKYCHP